MTAGVILLVLGVGALCFASLCATIVLASVSIARNSDEVS